MLAPLLWILAAAPVCTGQDQNQARGKPAWQSTDYKAATRAEKAVDGRTYTDFGDDATCTHTNGREFHDPTWWMVDLQSDIRVSSVVLYNRADCCTEKLGKFFLELHEMNPEECGNVTMVTSVYQDASLPGGPTTFTFDPARAARWVRVITYESQGVLTLCEVEVYGQPSLTAAHAGGCVSRQFRPVVLPQLGSLTSLAPLDLGPAQPAVCASQCLRLDQCAGFYLAGPPSPPLSSCVLLVPLPPGSPSTTAVPGPLTYYELQW